MKTFATAIAAAASLTSFAFAADMPARPILKAPPIAATEPWSGLYFGALVSVAKTKGEFDFVTIPGTGNLHPTGIMPGVVVGAGAWRGAAWIGFEADVGYDFSKTDNACVVVLDCQIKSSFFLTQRIVFGMPLGAITGAVQARANAAGSQWPASLSLPASFAASALMPYVTAGIAERRIEACVGAFHLGQSCGREWLVGWTAGAGLRIPVSAGISLDVSYLYVGYNKNFVTASGAAIFPATFDAKSEQVGRLMLLGHF